MPLCNWTRCGVIETALCRAWGENNRTVCIFQPVGTAFFQQWFYLYDASRTPRFAVTLYHLIRYAQYWIQDRLLSLSICVLFEILRFCPKRLCLSRRPSKSQRFKAHGGRPDQAEIPCPSFLGRPSPTDAWIILLGWMRIHTADCLQLMASIQVKCNTYSQ